MQLRHWSFCALQIASTHFRVLCVWWYISWHIWLCSTIW